MWWYISINWKVVEWFDKNPDWYLYSKSFPFKKLYIFLKAILSWSFPTLLQSYTGRKFDGSELSPFFGNGITFENFQISENLPSLKDLLNKIFSRTETSLATVFSILLLISSGPFALLGFKISMRVSISCDVQDILANLFWHLYSKAGTATFSSFTVEIVVKYLFCKSAFSSEEKQNSFWPVTEKEFRGGIEEEAQLLLTKWRTTFQNWNESQR